MRFSENLRKLRKEKEYSQEYLAEKLGVTRQTISKWENATAMPDLKKLTETADLFGVSMDALLGMELGDSSNAFDTDEQKKYTEELFSVAYQTQYEQNLANHKMLKTVSVVFAVATACIIFCIIIMFNEMTSWITDLQSQINQLNTNTTQQYYDDESESEFEYTLLNCDKEKPYMVNVEFTYSPKTYPKNAQVYFCVPQADGSIQRIDATEENSRFVATACIDITANGSSYVYMDDGESVTRDEIISDGFTSEDFIWPTIGIGYSCTADQEGIYCESDSLLFSYTIPENSLEEINAVYLIAQSGESQVFNKQLEMFKDEEIDAGGAGYSVELPNFTAQNSQKVSCIYLKLVTDSYSIRYYFVLNDVSDSIDSSSNQITNKVEIIFSDGKVITDEY